MTKFSLLPSLLVCVFGLVSLTSEAATVQYSGNLFGEYGGGPVSGGLVIAGTFAPNFDPHYYNCFYGDEACNLFGGAYEEAVADGNFIPIPFESIIPFPGTYITDQNGAFSASGTTNAPAGTPIWLWAFEDNSRESAHQVLASSTDPSWLTPAQSVGLTWINASEADIFVLGNSHPQGVELTVTPFPEPTSMALSLLGGLVVLGSRRRGRSPG